MMAISGLKYSTKEEVLMEDLMSKTKKELIEIIENQKHLAEAVEAKDYELSQKDVELERAQGRAARVDALEKEIAQLKKENTVLSKDSDGLAKDLQVEHEKKIKELEDNHKKALEKKDADYKALLEEYQNKMRQFDKWILTHGNLLKALQGTLDTHIDLNDLLIKELQAKKG
jgi:hypothetical protein